MQVSPVSITDMDNFNDADLEGVLLAMRCLIDYIELMEALNRQIDRIRKDCFDFDAQRQKVYSKLLVNVGKLQNKRYKMTYAEVKEALNESRFLVKEFLSLSDRKIDQFQVLQRVIRHRDYQREHGYRFALDHLEVELQKLYPEVSPKSRPSKRYKSPTRFPKKNEIPPDPDEEEEKRGEEQKELTVVPNTNTRVKAKREMGKAVVRKRSGSWRLWQCFWHNNAVEKSRLYCICQQKWNKHMIACANGSDCSTEWFHLECVNLLAKPEVEWYCNQCCNPPKALTFNVHNSKVKTK